MDRVFTYHELPFDNIRYAAIALCSVTPTQRYIGVLHRQPDSHEIRMLHLAWHHDLQNSTPKPKYLWIDPAIHARRLRQVAAVCRHIWRANGKAIPYAFSPPNDCFDEQTGHYLLGPTRHGLTCASFVLAIFERAGLNLADYATWPTDREGDREWQEWIVSQLEKSVPPASAEHIQAVLREVGSVRFRPEEVAGAATVSPLPAVFRLAVERGDQIVAKLTQGPPRPEGRG